jgi:GrpB-like predicted nucleotidyltransferase (UPF0157 family)
MLTKEQEKWLNHLSDTDKIKIIPYDKRAPEIFKKLKQKLDELFLGQVSLEHRGATALKISGQDEIDTYIPVKVEDFDKYIPQLSKLFGEPRSVYPDRLRFVAEIDKKHIDIFLIDKKAESWTNGIKFENYLKNNPESLEEYRKLKEDGNGVSVREYYTRKGNFIDEVLAKLSLHFC